MTTEVEGVDLPATELKGGCGLPSMGTRNQT